MATSVFDLFAKLSLDSTDFNKGLDAAKSAMGTIGKGVSAGVKVAGAAITAATTAVVGFGAASIKTGMSFDKSMSQVAATMGMSVEEINTEGSAAQQTFQQLNQFAQEMGRTTAFSASEAADALNYMALAGYDADTSMKMLPNVLNLAAAGGMELATASDMVTDTQSALGLSLEETTELVDKMAKASSKSNTSVQQLGEAMLTIGGTAKNLSGGTTELSQALGLLADNGIKGAEGGTALRNILLNLTPKSEEAAKAMEQIGLQAYDADGKMRPLKDIFADLNKGMEGMTDQEKTQILSNIFNKVDLKSINALMATNVERWDELSDAIDNSKGAAETMANTQLDNLAGDITLLKSAFEGAQIAVSNKLTPSIRDFAKKGTDAISKFASAVDEGGLSAGIASIGQSLAQGITDISAMLPDAINAGIELMNAIAQGVAENAPAIATALGGAVSTLASAGLSLMQNIASGMAEFDWAGTVGMIADGLNSAVTSEGTSDFLQCATSILSSLMEGIGESAPVIAEKVPEIITNIVTSIIDNLDGLIDGGIKMAEGLSQGMMNGQDAIIEQIPTLVESIAGAILSNAPKLIAAWIQIHVQLMAHVPQLIAELIAAIGQSLVGIINQIIAFGQQIIPQVVTIGAQILSNVVTFLSQLPTKIAYWVGYAVSRFITELSQLPSKVKEKFNEVMTNAQEMFNKLKTEGPKAAKDMADKFLKAMQNLPANIKKLGKTVVEKLKEGISSAWGAFVTWLMEKLSSIGSAFMKGAKDGKSKGKSTSSSSNVSSISDIGSASIENMNGTVTISSKESQKNEQLVDYEQLAGAMVKAFAQTDFTMEIDDREFGRVVRKAVAY